MADPYAYQDPIAKGLADRGLVIEAGWIAMRTILRPMSPDQEKAMEFAYWSSAQHLWATIMRMLDPGPEETDADIARMEGIAKEFEKHEAVVRDYLREHGRR